MLSLQHEQRCRYCYLVTVDSVNKLLLGKLKLKTLMGKCNFVIKNNSWKLCQPLFFDVMQMQFKKFTFFIHIHTFHWSQTIENHT